MFGALSFLVVVLGVSTRGAKGDQAIGGQLWTDLVRKCSTILPAAENGRNCGNIAERRSFCETFRSFKTRVFPSFTE